MCVWIVDVVDQDLVVVVDLFVDVVLGVLEVVEGVCVLQCVWQLGDWIEQELLGMVVYVECYICVQCVVQYLWFFIVQVGGMVGGEQQVYGFLLQLFVQCGLGVVWQWQVLFVVVVVVVLWCYYQCVGGVGGVGVVGLWLGECLFVLYVCVGEVQLFVVVLV